jgi:hypothetical protein
LTPVAFEDDPIDIDATEVDNAFSPNAIAEIPLATEVPPIAIAPPADVIDAVSPIAMPLDCKQTAGAPIAMLLDPVHDAA